MGKCAESTGEGFYWGVFGNQKGILGCFKNSYTKCAICRQVKLYKVY